MDESVFNKIFSAAAGVWTLVLMAAVALFKAWPTIMGRINERRRDALTERNSDWDHMQELHGMLAEEVRRLSERLKAVEAENDECRENLAKVRDDLAEERAARVNFQAYLEGRGQADQHAQLILSAERQKDQAKKPEAPK